MTQKSLILNFKKDVIEFPVIAKMIRKFDIDVNILQARINPEEDGYMFTIISGDISEIEKAMNFLKEAGVGIAEPKTNVDWKEELCVNCGACIPICVSQALKTDPDTRKTVYDSDKCIACELCILACSYKAIEPVNLKFRHSRGK